MLFAQAVKKAVSMWIEAAALPDAPPSLKVFLTGVGPWMSAMYFSYLCPQEGWNPNPPCSEEQLFEAIKFYDPHICGPVIKKLWYFDPSPWGNTAPAVLRYGSFEAHDLWNQKTLAYYQELDLGTSKDYATELFEVSGMCQLGCAFSIYIGQPADAAALLNSIGFTWDKNGLENFNTWFSAVSAAVPFFVADVEAVFNRLIIFLSSPDGTIDEAEVNNSIPSPAAIAEMEQGSIWTRVGWFYDITSFGANAFLKLGRDDDAYELARLTVAPEQKTLKKSTLVSCHSILGQVAAKRGNMEEADGHFAHALEEAKLSSLPMLEVLAARDWKQHALEPAGRDCNPAESIIDMACTNMNKSREQIKRVLA